MKKILLIICLLFSFGADAAKFGEREYIECDGVRSMAPSNATLKMFHVGITTAGNWSGFADLEQMHATTPASYVVPGGKQLVIYCARMITTTASQNLWGNIGSDSVAVVMNGTTGFTDPLYAAGRVCASGSTNPTECTMVVPNMGLNLQNDVDHPMKIVIAAGRYPFYRQGDGSSVSVRIWGYLEDI